MNLCVQRHGKLGGLSGRWDYSFKITSTGTTKSIKVRAKSSSHSDFEKCLADKIKAWKFPVEYEGVKLVESIVVN